MLLGHNWVMKGSSLTAQESGRKWATMGSNMIVVASGGSHFAATAKSSDFSEQTKTNFENIFKKLTELDK